MTDPRPGSPGDAPDDGDLIGEPDEAEVDAGETGPTTSAQPRGREARRLRGRPATPPATVSEQAVHIDDRISKLFVAGTVAVFVLILLNGLLLGRNGALSPTPTPTPVPSATAAPSGSSPASGSPGASGSAPAPGSAAPSAS
jgi:hypothetical protein